ncbi:MAG: tRNA dihydrouridine synthase DusB [candidate division KSB1 bacterium]|nr:tRNA dihydrouridine synthase DusB [candidate division KSB1 bacterium]
MKLGKIHLKGRMILAPMAGISDSSFRMICRRMGAALVFTEMVSADGLLQGNPQSMQYLFYRPEEHPIGFQIFGSDADKMARAVELILPRQPDVIDLNFGCPVKKVVKRGAGAALLKFPERLREIAVAVVKASSVPVIAKIRLGWDQQHVNAFEVGPMLEDCGISAITLHARTQSQQYHGQADWSAIAKLKTLVTVPVIGNGDVRTAADAKRMLDDTGCDLVMIGRAALGNPWLFQQAHSLLETGQTLSPPGLSERLAIMLHHLEDCASVRGEMIAVYEMRKHLAWYTHGLPGSTQLRARLFQLKTIVAIKELLQEYFRMLLAQD